MANISQELQTIKDGVYGEDIRMAIHDGIEKINDGSGGFLPPLEGIGVWTGTRDSFNSLSSHDLNILYIIFDEVPEVS